MPYEIATVEQLQCVGEAPHLGGHFKLVDDIDASGTSLWNGGAGFDPIGSASDSFIGTFDGDGHTISDLTIDRDGTTSVGLFSYLGSGGMVTNVTLEDAFVFGGSQVGGLVGSNDGGMVADASAVVDISAGGGTVGGLAGYNSGTVTNSSAASDDISGDDSVGGLVGFNDGGTVYESSATGSVFGRGDGVGGLVGYNAGGTVTGSSATGP